MAIRLECPRCKQALSVPNKKAGSYAACPRCQGRLWVPQDAPADGAHLETIVLAAAGPVSETAPLSSGPPSSVSMPPPVVAPPSAASPSPVSAPIAAAPPRVKRTAAPPNVTPPNVTPPNITPASVTPTAPVVPHPAVAPSVAPSSKALAPASSAPPVAAKPQGRKVARLIAAEAAASPLKLAADGRLPELQLEEGQQKQKTEAKSKSVSPLVLFGAIGLSVLLSAALVLIEPGQSGPSTTQQKDDTRKLIEEKYFGGGALEGGRLQPYNLHLRAAQEAHLRGDEKTEREMYGKVLDLLRADPGARDPRALPGSRSRYVTGGADGDKDLEAKIILLLGGS
jgi:hypothetical protein